MAHLTRKKLAEITALAYECYIKKIDVGENHAYFRACTEAYRHQEWISEEIISDLARTCLQKAI